MHKSLIRILLAAGAVAAAAVGGATQATAADTWTVQPGGTFTASLPQGQTATLTDTNTRATLTCSVGTAGGVAKSGSGLSGTAIASVTSGSFGSSADPCDGPLGSRFTVTLTPGTTWLLDAQSFDSGTGVTTGLIRNVDTTLSGSSFLGRCSARATGTVSGTYTNSTAALALNEASLTISNVSGNCANLIRNGDHATLDGTAVVNPRQSITSP